VAAHPCGRSRPLYTVYDVTASRSRDGPKDFLDGFIQHLPPRSLGVLASLDQGAVAKRRAATPTREHTHSVAGVKLSDGWTASEALGFLKPLVALARGATAGQPTDLLTEA
jgi:hypothetical protein